MAKNPSANVVQDTQVWSLGQEDPLEKETATHSSILSWENPKDRWGRRESDIPGNPGTTYCYTIESKVQDPHLVAQRFLPLSNNSFHGPFGSWRRVMILGPMRRSVFGEKESSKFTGQGLQGSGAGQTSVAGTLRLRGTFYSPRLSTGSLCRALGSTVHLPIWPDEEQGDCVIKGRALERGNSE